MKYFKFDSINNNNNKKIKCIICIIIMIICGSITYGYMSNIIIIDDNINNTRRQLNKTECNISSFL